MWISFHLSILSLFAAILLAVHFTLKAFMAWIITGVVLISIATGVFFCSVVSPFELKGIDKSANLPAQSFQVDMWVKKKLLKVHRRTE